MKASELMAAIVGALGAGAIGFIFFFAKQYFIRKDERQNKNEDRVDQARLDIAGINARLDEQTKTLQTIVKELGFIDRKLSKIFGFIDAPQRATDMSNKKTI